MGWDYTLRRAEPGEVTRSFTKGWTTKGGEVIQVTDAAWASFRHLWGVERVNGVPREIVLWLVDFRRDSWGHTGMMEGSHPFYYDCPLSILDKAPATCPEWRARVREYHAKQRRQIAIGQCYILRGYHIGAYHDPTVVITSVKPLRGSHFGSKMKLSRGQLADAELIAGV